MIWVILFFYIVGIVPVTIAVIDSGETVTDYALEPLVWGILWPVFLFFKALYIFTLYRILR